MMKTRVIGMATAVGLFAVSGLVDSAHAALGSGPYTLTLSGVRGSKSEPASISGSGAATSLVVGDVSGTLTIPLSVSASGAFHGSGSANGYTLALTGTVSGSTASGSSTATKNGRTASMSFTLAPMSMTAPRLPPRVVMDQSQQGNSVWTMMYYFIFGMPEDPGQQGMAGARG